MYIYIIYIFNIGSNSNERSYESRLGRIEKKLLIFRPKYSCVYIYIELYIVCMYIIYLCYMYVCICNVC